MVERGQSEILSLVINRNQRKANNDYFLYHIPSTITTLFQNQFPEGLDNLGEAAYYFLSLNPDAQKLRNQAFGETW